MTRRGGAVRPQPRQRQWLPWLLPRLCRPPTSRRPSCCRPRCVNRPGRPAIQVGAFASLATAEQAAETARSAAPELLRTAKIELPPTAPFGAQVAFRARLAGLSQTAAASACSRLSAHGTACITVPPSGTSF
jgi:hypothetical protein